MVNSNDEILNSWGRKLLTDNGYKVTEAENIRFELELEADGCCDECFSEYPSLKVVGKSGSVMFADNVCETLLSLVDFARKG